MPSTRVAVIRLLERLTVAPGHCLPYLHERLFHFRNIKLMLATKYPNGAKGLVAVEKWRGRGKGPVRMLVLAKAGSELLEALKLNPKAVPPSSIYRRQQKLTIQASEFQKAKNEKYFRDKKRKLRWKVKQMQRAARCEDPPDPEAYLEYIPGAEHMTDKQIGHMPVARRIAALRTRAGINQPQPQTNFESENREETDSDEFK